jgi:hypothetical protein
VISLVGLAARAIRWLVGLHGAILGGMETIGPILRKFSERMDRIQAAKFLSGEA